MREPVLWHVLVVVGWEGLATVEQHGYAQCHHHALLSTLLLSAVHPVTLYTHTQPSTVPPQQGAVCSGITPRPASYSVSPRAVFHPPHHAACSAASRSPPAACHEPPHRRRTVHPHPHHPASHSCTTSLQRATAVAATAAPATTPRTDRARCAPPRARRSSCKPLNHDAQLPQEASESQSPLRGWTA